MTTDENRTTVADGVDYVLVAAVAENGVIGRDGGMPWHFPDDMAHFKQTTTGHPVILGRKTYESVLSAIGEPFPGRLSVVLSSRDLELPDGAVLANSVEAAAERAESAAAEMGVRTVYVAGGGRVYEQFLPRATRMVLTEVHDGYEGDTRFPEWDEAEWTETDRERGGEFDFVTYDRDG
ncbi:dihydrofolate reductase [Halogeometricum limi]|uniref:dihydrofolate reductase n=1 Tax=Halogeometricum limi TaxID=555875 RepID=A0A1I6HU33_9EURY|nr:dihydrofolate reductase [Halogeometricum limi]SFR57933.1 dihydrofolate reductase [Halogeometricum limi]